MKKRLLFLGLSLLLMLSIYLRPTKELNYTTVIVRQGDTLWSIAKENCDGFSISEAVYEIQQKNSISSFIKPGQKLEVPIK